MLHFLCQKVYPCFIEFFFLFFSAIGLSFWFFYSKKRENRDNDLAGMQWSQNDTNAKLDNEMKKNGENKLTQNAVADDTPKINPVKWTVCTYTFFWKLFTM